MKSKDSIVKFLSILSALSSTIGSLDKLSCQPPEQTDLPDPLQSICATHSTNILCQSHGIGWLQLLALEAWTALAQSFAKHEIGITSQ